MKKIELTQGKYAIVDDEDYPYLSRFSWVYYSGGSEVEHAATPMRIGKDKSIHIPMSKMVMGSKQKYRVTHKNGDGLDFRKENLLFVTFQLSKQRAKKQTTFGGKWVSSKYKGVYSQNTGKRKTPKPWRARIEKDGKQYNCGSFYDEKEAAIAYNAKALELYGEFAYQNKIEP